MNTNPIIKELGYENNDVVVIIHADDIGMCQASISAFKTLWEVGIISSGATMVPCPWFLEAANLFKEDKTLDLGVHTTITSEWETYRWGPISSRDPTTGLIDRDGYFFRSVEDAQYYGKPKAVQLELKMQIERAISVGIDITHVDTHMGAVGSLKFIPAYLDLAKQFAVPPMLMRFEKKDWLKMGFDEEMAKQAENLVYELEEQRIPLIDHIATLELDRAEEPEERIAYAIQVLGDLKPGITHYIIHPSTDTPELRAITPDWRCRVADSIAFQSKRLSDYIKDKGIQVIGYRRLRDLMRNS